MPEKRMHILCGIKHASHHDPRDDELVAVLAIRRDRPPEKPHPSPLTLEAHLTEAPEWLFSAAGAVTHCAVTTGYDIGRGVMQARVTLSCSLDLCDDLSLDYGLDTENLLHAAISEIRKQD